MMPLAFFNRTISACVSNLGQTRVLEKEITRTRARAKPSGGDRAGNLELGESRTERRAKSLDIV